MSNANKPAKVLRVALRRIERGWMKMGWARKNKQTGVTEICLEGAIFGYKNDTKNPACVMAKDITLQLIQETYRDEDGKPLFDSIPRFNDDPDTTKEMVMEVAKKALIRAETGGLLRKTEEECYGSAKKALTKGKFL